MLAVVMIIMAAVGLRLLDKITPEAVVSMLSGIAGYVLGGVSRTSQEAQKQEQPERGGETHETSPNPPAPAKPQLTNPDPREQRS